MKSIRPQDRPKLIGLSVGAVLVLALIFYRVHSVLDAGPDTSTAPKAVAMGSAPAESTTSSGAASKPSPTVGTATPGATVKPKDADAKVTPLIGSTKLDPFRSQEPRTSKPIETMKGPIVANQGKSDKKGGTNPMPPFGADGLIVKTDLQVTGLVSGSVAVIRIGTRDYVVARGGTFGPGYKLVQADGSHVVISQGLAIRTIWMDVSFPT